MTKVKKVLVLGSGGREHVFIWKLSADLSPDQLFVAPGNAGMTHLATQVNLGVLEFEKIAQFCLQHHIEIILPGGEDALVAGIVDYFKAIPELQHIYVFGPSKEAAQLEGSKTYCKAFMQKYGIPTAAYQSFTSEEIEEAFEFLKTLKPPYVLKADGLAAGKGVLILPDYETAAKELELMLLHSKFGAAGNRVVIEEFMDGIEFSVFVMTDNEGYIILPEAKDYKRVGDGDTGLNTGGMGAVSPVPFVDEELRKKVIQTIIEPTMRGLKEEHLEYRGFSD
jgi:phosphoribosylamine--glycine ligase